MSDELFDWGEAHARSADPETSQDAADEVRGAKAGRMEQMVVDALCALGGDGTAWEVENFLGEQGHHIDSNTVTPRFKPLEKKGRIERTDRRRPGRTGKATIVWKLKTPQDNERHQENGTGAA